MEQVQTGRPGVQVKAAAVAPEAQMVATGPVLWAVALAVAVEAERKIVDRILAVQVQMVQFD